MAFEIIPVFLGADLNCYNFARAFHEAYGVKSYAFGRYEISATKYSKIINFKTVPDIDNEETMPFDQHWLISANLPHRAYVASAEGDTWACPQNEYLSCVAASRYYEENGKTGFIPDGDTPKLRNPLHEGMIGHHMRPGLHFLSREDWNYYIDYLEKQFSK